MQLDSSVVTLTIRVMQAERVPKQERIRAHVKFTVSSGGKKHKFRGGAVELPFSGWYDHDRTVPWEYIARELSHALFGSEDARIALERFDGERRVSDSPGRIIVDLSPADPLLQTVRWELLHHPIYPYQPLVDLSNVLLRTDIRPRRRPDLRALPSPAQLTVAVASSEPQNALDDPAYGWHHSPFRVEPLKLGRHLRASGPLEALAVVMQPLLRLQIENAEPQLSLWAYDEQQQIYPFDLLTARWEQSEKPPVVVLLHDRNTPSAATLMAGARLHEAGAPIVIVLPPVIRPPADAVVVAQQALEQLLVDGSLFPLRWWRRYEEGEQPVIWTDRPDGRLFERDLRSWAAEFNRWFEQTIWPSDEREQHLLATLQAYVRSEKPYEAEWILQQARELQRELNQREQPDYSPTLAETLQPPELLRRFNLVRPEELVSALQERAERRRQTGPRERPRKVTITAPELIVVNERHIVTVEVAALVEGAELRRQHWLEWIFTRINPQTIDLRTVSFDIMLTVHGARLESIPIKRITITPDLPAPPIDFSIIADQPGNINLFVEVKQAGDEERPAGEQYGVVGGNHLQLRAVHGAFTGREAGGTIEQSSSFRVSGSREEPLTVTAPPLQALLMTLRLEPQERAGDYRASLHVYVPDDRATYELLEAEPVHLDPTRLLAYQHDPYAYGQELKEALLATDTLRRSWAQAIGFYRGMGRMVRLRLHLVGSTDHLHTTQWETLIDPGGDQPLALSRRVLLSRYLSSPDAQRGSLLRRTGQPVRIAVAVANPLDIEQYQLGRIDVKAEVDAVSGALAAGRTTIVGNYPLYYEQGRLGKATLGSILEAANGAQILYLICHSRRIVEANDTLGVEPASSTYVMLERSNGLTDPIKAAEFATALAQLPQPPSLVVLGSCFSAGDGYQEAVRSLGPLLCKAGVPAVLAFQGLVAVTTLRGLVPALLRELLNQEHGEEAVDLAVATARTELLGEQWWQPVLWLRRDDGRAW